MSSKKVLKNSFLYTFVAFLQKGTGLLLLPIYTAYLTPEDYGTMNLITSISGFMSLLFLCSLHAAASRYHFKYKTADERSVVWGTMLFMVLINSLFLGSISIIFHKYLIDPLTDNIEFFPLVFFSIISTTLSPLYLFYQRWLQCEQEGLKYTLNLFSNFLIQTGLNLLSLVVFNKGVYGIIFSTFIVSLIFFIYSLFRFLPHVKLQINKDIAKESLSYSIPLVPHSLTGYLSFMLDRVLINKLIGISQVGIYSVANQFGSILNIVTTSINQAFTPWLYSTVEEEDGYSFSKLSPIYRFAEVSTILICLIAFIIVLYSPEVIQLMTSSGFHSAWIPVVFVSFGFVFNGLYYFFSAPLFLSYPRYMVVISFITLLINLVFNYVFIPTNGAVGAGLAFFMSQFFCTILSLIYAKHYESRIKYNWLRMYLISFLFIILSCAVFLLQAIDLFYLRILLKLIYTTLILGAVLILYRQDIIGFRYRFLKK